MTFLELIPFPTASIKIIGSWAITVSVFARLIKEALLRSSVYAKKR
jgi:hypothetical protein